MQKYHYLKVFYYIILDKRTCVLDLDECLIYSANTYIEGTKYIFSYIEEGNKKRYVNQ